MLQKPKGDDDRWFLAMDIETGLAIAKVNPAIRVACLANPTRPINNPLIGDGKQELVLCMNNENKRYTEELARTLVLQDEKKRTISQPHDKAIKKVLSNLAAAKDLLSCVLPEKILSLVDLNHLALQRDSFIDDEHRAFEVDLLYKTKFKGEEGYIWVLLNINVKMAPGYQLGYLNTCALAMTLKHFYRKDLEKLFEQELADVYKKLEDAGYATVIIDMLYYVLNEGEYVDLDKLKSIISSKFSREVEDKVMTIAQQLEAKGKQSGIELVAKRMLAENMEIALVAKLTGLTQTQVEQLKKKNH